MARPPIARPEPVLFDFRAPPQLPATTRLSLESIHGRFAASLRTLLTPRFRQVADAEPVGIEVIRSDQYAQQFGGDGIRFIVGLGGPASGQVVFQFGASLAAHCVDRLLGGSADAEQPAHPPTGIERAILTDFVQRLLPLLRDAAAEIIPLVPVAAHLAPGPDAPALVAPGQTVAVLSLQWRCGAVTGPFEVALPLALLEGARPGIAAADVRPLVEGHLRLAHVTVTARIGFRATAFDVASMQPGTVLSTGHPSHADIEVAANGQRLFTGMLGRHLGHAGVRILREVIDDSTTSRSSRRTSSP